MSTSVVSSPVTSVPKGRKGSAAGGGKAWTEEEEVYLLQMRLQKVAYKKIAAHLDKTELACRLHYHQLSHGGNRRKRTNSLSSNSSDKSASSPVQTPSGADSSRQRSPTLSRLSPISSTGAIQKLQSNTPSKIKGKPLLPKPADGSTPSRKQSPAKSKQLRVNCETGSIDREKLQRIVETHRKQFWVNVADQYGGPFSPEYLEQCWANGLKSGPPTPAISPQSKAGSPVSSCGPEDAGTPESLKSMTMETISELPTPQPLVASGPSSPAASSESVPQTQAENGSDDTMVVEPSPSEEQQQKVEKVEHSPDVTMNDIPETGESEHWSE
ncbi:hypothetical protein BDZ91DRAFT_332201 [Kalaharituber pfeilii]|nr:hypothetical protein BDZ91DRAFT_332201 [Kalaharituber pfeilii]